MRQVRPRAEYIVPAICLLVLALALTWNALSTPNEGGPSVSGTTVAGTEIAVVGTTTSGTAATGTSVAIIVPTVVGAYPGPEGVGTPVAGGDLEAVPTFDSGAPPVTDSAVPAEGFPTPTLPDFSAPPVVPGDGSGYPGDPAPGQDPGVPAFPTDDPNAFPAPDYGGGVIDFPTPDYGGGVIEYPTPDYQTVPTSEPFPTDAPFTPPDDQFPTGPAYPAPEQPTDESFPTDETPIVDDPNAPLPTDDPNAPLPTDDPNAPPPAETDAPATEPTATLPPTPTSPPPPTVTPAPTATPTPDPAVLIEGNVRWPAQGPIVLSQNHIVTPGSSLTIDPGVEVRVKPGVKLFVEGTLRAAGIAGNPVRISGPEGRWHSIIGQPGSTISLEHTEIRNAGRGGVAISSSGGTLSLTNVTLTDGGGGIVADGAAVNIRGSQITGNDLSTGSPLAVRMAPGRAVTIHGTIIGGNLMPNGTSNARLIVGAAGGGPLDIQGNTFVGGTGPLLDLQTATAVGGTVRCNSFRGGNIGLQLNSSTPSADGFTLAVDTNAFEGQTSYGVASTIALNAANNWWGDPSGPADTQRNPQGTGVRVGVNVGFAPHLQARPPCSPTP